MSSGPTNPSGPTLEMRLAAIEDKLSKMSVSQADVQAFQKVGSLAAPSTSLIPTVCTTCFHCVVSVPVHVPVHTGIFQQSQLQETGGSGFEKLGK